MRPSHPSQHNFGLQHISLFLMSALAFSSCEKAEEFTTRLKASIKNEIAATTPDEPDPALFALVDETEEGVIFRRDLPFPTDLEIIQSTNMQMRNVRVFAHSELGSESAILNQKYLLVANYKLSPNRMHIALKNIQLLDSDTADETGNDSVPATLPKKATSIDFMKKDGAWKASGTTDFKKIMLQRHLLENIDELLAASGALPRPLWFSGNRIRPGEVLRIDNEQLPVLIDGKAKGKIELTFIGVESVSGHPCGAFSIKGNYTANDTPRIDGSRISEETTIESGKIWMSLLYPVILQYDMELIQTLKSASGGGPVEHLHGGIHMKVTREWKPGQASFE